MELSKKGMIALTAMSVAVLGAQMASAAQITVSTDVNTTRTWTSDNEYILTKPIYVTSGATLTINAGTVVRGEPGATGVEPGALIVMRGSKIKAMGTCTQPIVMTDMNDNHFVGPSPSSGTSPYSTANNGLTKLWGGLILLGNCYIADGAGDPAPSKTKQVEGLLNPAALYGGGDDNDDSGEIHFVSIRYGGYVLGESNEINGLTLGAVGRETDIDHVEIFQNKDDGIEWFGGTVNTKYILVWSVGDDSFDWDEGFRGKGQFWCSVKGVLSSEGDVSDKNAEMDGSTGSDSIQPSSIPTVFNTTYVGLGKGNNRQKDLSMHFRDGTGGRYYNMIAADFDGAIALIEGELAGTKYESADNTQVAYSQGPFPSPVPGLPSGLANFHGFDHPATPGAPNKRLEICNSVFNGFGFADAKGLVADSGLGDDWGAEGPGKEENKPFLGFETGYSLFQSAFNNAYFSESLSVLSAINRVATPVVINSVNYYPVQNMNPLVGDFGGIEKTWGLKPPANDAFYTPVQFVGAFCGGNWAAWTCAAKQGMLSGTAQADCTYTGIEPTVSEVGTQLVLDLATDMYAGMAADWWVVALTPFPGLEVMYYDLGTGGFTPGLAPTLSNAGLFDLTALPVLDTSILPAGNTYTFIFGVDLDPDGALPANLSDVYMGSLTVTK